MRVVIVAADSAPLADCGPGADDDVVIRPDWAQALADDADCVILHDVNASALATARRIAADDPALQVIVVAPAASRAALERAMLFTSGVGEVWIREPAQLSRTLLGEAAEVTRQRRAYRATHRRMEHDLAAIEPHAARRAVISDAYLAALLAVLPDPVISIDERNAVLSWNAAAEQTFGMLRGRVLGRTISDVLRPLDRAAFERLLDHDGPGGPRRAELLFEREAGETLAADVVAVTVEAERRRVRALLVHDVTERRNQQQELEANAAELEQQAEELHHQSAVLEEAEAELRRTNEELRATNAALVEQTQAAERARIEAEAANRAKSDFLATMSHEIRTPINAIIGYTDLLQMGLAGPLLPQQADHLDRITMSSRHLLRLIEDVLDLAKVEAGRVSVRQESGVVVTAVAGAVELVAPQAEARSLRLGSRSVDDDDTLYIGDEHRVRQILVNLLTNAVKFTEPGGEVEVTYGSTSRDDAPRRDEAGGWSWVTVRDSGPGVERRDQKRIFRPFEQAESGRTRTHGGAGLGLAISRELARLMGGDITVRSEPGAGAEFTLWLPRISAPVPPAPAEGEAAPLQLHAVGTTLLRELDPIADAMVKRLRIEVPAAAGLEDHQLRDHLPTWVAEVAQVLMDLGAGSGVPVQLRDGVEIRRLMAELHGLQRAGLGWSEDALIREMEILGEEIERVTHVRTGEGNVAELARGITGRLVAEARATSLAALRRAADG